jgi:hypothetical protein
MSAFSAVASQLKSTPPPPPQDAGWRNNYREEKSRGKQQSQKIINFDSPKNLFIGTFELKIFFVAVE